MRKQLALSLAHLKQAQQQLTYAEKKNEAEKIRQHISRDIHDEVGAYAEVRHLELKIKRSMPDVTEGHNLHE